MRILKKVPYHKRRLVTIYTRNKDLILEIPMGGELRIKRKHFVQLLEIITEEVLKMDEKDKKEGVNGSEEK